MAPACNRLLHTGQNARRVLEVVLLAKSAQLLHAGVLAFTHHQSALLPGRAVREREIIGRSEGPRIGVIQHE